MCGKILGGLSSQNLASGAVVCMCDWGSTRVDTNKSAKLNLECLSLTFISQPTHMLWVLKRTVSILEREREREREREGERESFLRSKTKIGISVLPSMEITESFDALYTIKLNFLCFSH